VKVAFPTIECGHGSIDDNCGCRRSMAGIVSHRATTTMKVADKDGLDPDTYFTLISDGLKDQGYVTDALKADPEVNEWLHHLTDELMYLAGRVPPGTVLEWRGEFINVRQSSGGR
jgi:hypothetical protein